jgi:hypothetical protein
VDPEARLPDEFIITSVTNTAVTLLPDTSIVVTRDSAAPLREGGARVAARGRRQGASGGGQPRRVREMAGGLPQVRGAAVASPDTSP